MFIGEAQGSSNGVSGVGYFEGSEASNTAARKLIPVWIYRKPNCIATVSKRWAVHAAGGAGDERTRNSERNPEFPHSIL